MVFYEPNQPELYQGRNLDAAYDRFAHRQRVELVHAWDEASFGKAAARFDGRAFTRDAGYEGPGEGTGTRIVPASFYGPGVFASLAAWSRADAWVTFLAKASARRALVRLPAGRADARPLPRSAPHRRRDPRGTPARAARCPRSSHGRSSRRCGRDRHLGGAAAGARPRRRRIGAGCRPQGVVLQRRTTERADPRDRRAADRRPRGWMGRIQAPHRRVLLLARRPLAAQPAEAGGAAAERAGRTRSPSTTAVSRTRPTSGSSTVTGCWSTPARTCCIRTKTAASPAR